MINIASIIVVMLLCLCMILVSSFSNVQIAKLKQCTISSSRVEGISWLLDRFKGVVNKNNIFEDQDVATNKINTNMHAKEKEKKVKGKVIRCGARSYKDDGSSKPSSAKYTTRKNEYPSLQIDASGVIGDYNHYRTTALSSTKDRAVSILTNDVIKVLNNEGIYLVNPGDLGENILVDEVTYHYFQVGKKYFIGETASTYPDSDGKLRRGVEIEITEPIVACANLCKLPIINQSQLQPKARIKRCMDFLKRLDHENGVRGWYAKILGNGEVRIGDGVIPLESNA